MIKDSGERREFETGAVRDIQEGKGRCDLLPLDIVSTWAGDSSLGVILYNIDMYLCSKSTNSNAVAYIYQAMCAFCSSLGWSTEDALLEVSVHYEEGAKKYGENNWQKGIPSHCYLDSGIRHLLKYYRGDTDERHDRAFIWNMLGLLWNDSHKSELNDIMRGENN